MVLREALLRLLGQRPGAWLQCRQDVDSDHGPGPGWVREEDGAGGAVMAALRVAEDGIDTCWQVTCPRPAPKSRAGGARPPVTLAPQGYHWWRGGRDAGPRPCPAGPAPPALSRLPCPACPVPRGAISGRTSSQRRRVEAASRGVAAALRQLRAATRVKALSSATASEGSFIRIFHHASGPTSFEQRRRVAAPPQAACLVPICCLREQSGMTQQEQSGTSQHLAV